MQPTVSMVTPNVGAPGGGASVTIQGTNLSDSVVDFGNVPASVNTDSPTQITATAPPATGIMNVRVTNIYGTSAASPACEFTAPSPSLPPAISAISPSSGPTSGSFLVTINGSEFALTPELSITFGESNPAKAVLVSWGEIVVEAPAGQGTVNVTVTTQAGSSNPVPFTYGPPVVASVSPACGAFGIGIKPTNALVTITGAGFGSSGTLQFGSNPVKQEHIKSWTPTQIQAYPPNVSSTGHKEIVDVQVTSSGQTSEQTPADQYTYYNPAEIFS